MIDNQSFQSESKKSGDDFELTDTKIVRVADANGDDEFEDSPY